MPRQALKNVPYKKVEALLNDILASCEECSKNGATTAGGMCKRCALLTKAFNRYADANIPVRYWNLEMHKDFKGDDILKEYYNEIVANLRATYNDGKNLCFAGSFGLGKTMVCTNILKRAVEKGYDGLYVTLPDIISAMSSNDRYDVRNELISVDFLVVDEFDPRYMATEHAADFFGRVIEDILRMRSHNCLPTFMCTNSPNLTEGFSGAIKQSLTSLMHEVETVIALGSDYRAKGKE